MYKRTCHILRTSTFVSGPSGRPGLRQKWALPLPVRKSKCLLLADPLPSVYFKYVCTCTTCELAIRAINFNVAMATITCVYQNV